ncbi:hypothetical protein QL285_039657 [Trifolium repens]|nr:hypothetical protein QL285_039657 [Trifolium repens]
MNNQGKRKRERKKQRKQDIRTNEITFGEHDGDTNHREQRPRANRIKEMIELGRFVIIIAAAIQTKNADSLQTAKARRNITVGIDKAATFHLLVPQIVCRYLLNY